jgi:hypothetical protein
MQLLNFVWYLLGLVAVKAVAIIAVVSATIYVCWRRKVLRRLRKLLVNDW